jgi:hypothetical protein
MYKMFLHLQKNARALNRGRDKTKEESEINDY